VTLSCVVRVCARCPVASGVLGMLGMLELVEIAHSKVTVYACLTLCYSSTYFHCCLSFNPFITIL